jgi:hypothetical protein
MTDGDERTSPLAAEVDPPTFFERAAAVERRYEGRAMTEMYYPQSGVIGGCCNVAEVFRTTSAGAGTACCICGAAFASAVRCFKGEALYCNACLRARWLDTTPAAGGTARLAMTDVPLEVVSIIFSFCSDYHAYARWCRVSQLWFDAANMDTWSECDATRTKRHLLVKELEYQAVAIRAAPARTREHLDRFRSQLELAPLLGEWADEEAPPAEPRRLDLALLIVTSSAFRGAAALNVSAGMVNATSQAAATDAKDGLFRTWASPSADIQIKVGLVRRTGVCAVETTRTGAHAGTVVVELNALGVPELVSKKTCRPCVVS